jgi:hypothetical protein
MAKDKGGHGSEKRGNASAGLTKSPPRDYDMAAAWKNMVAQRTSDKQARDELANGTPPEKSGPSPTHPSMILSERDDAPGPDGKERGYANPSGHTIESTGGRSPAKGPYGIGNRANRPNTWRG